MFDFLVRKEMMGMPLGFVAALACCLGGLVAGWDIALSLGRINSFGEIARSSAMLTVFGLVGAVLAVATTHRLDND